MVQTKHPQIKIQNKSVTPASHYSSYSCATKDGKRHRNVETVAEKGWGDSNQDFMGKPPFNLLNRIS